MNIVFLSPHFPPNYYQFCTGLRKAGATVLGIADAAYEELRPELRAALTEYYRVSDMNDYDQVLRATGYFTHQHGKIDRFESHNEHWLETDAKIRTDFNIPGIHADIVTMMKSKSRMKQKFIEAGVLVAPGALVRTLKDAEALIATTGYPVVAKPDIGVGAARTYKINNSKDLFGFFQAKPPVDYFLEGFIQGTLYSFDGLTDQDGTVVFSTCHCFSAGIMDNINKDLDMYYYSLRTIPPALEKAGRAAVKAFDVRERFFHIEFFLTDEGKAVALEVNMRPPGGLTMDMFNYANDIDLYAEWANVVMHNRFEATVDRKYHCAHIGRKNGKHYVLSHDAVLEKFGALIVHHEPISGIFSGAIGNYGYLVRSQGLDEVLRAARSILAKTNER